MEAILRAIKKILPASVIGALRGPYHFLLAYAAAARFWFPGRGLMVIGVTGTKGKTTVVRLLHEVLSASGASVVSVSSLEYRIGQTAVPNTLKMTMPGRFFIQRLLRRGVTAGCRYAVVEVTSQGIVQFRHRGIPFAGAVMTNIAPEHIEAHGGFEPYLRAKLDLFWRLPRDGIAVLNTDDRQWQRFSAATPARAVSYSRESIVIGGKRWSISDLAINKDGITFALGGTPVRSPLLGTFNFYNILAAITVGLSQGLAPERITAAIERVAGVPGRMEFVARDPVAAVVDYAHTPDSLEAVYTSLKGLEASSRPKRSRASRHRLICVLGATGGGRDTWKRPIFGAIAEKYCDEIILTDEDPYDEDPAAIIAAVARGITTGTFREILDRREAITEALRSAGAGDTVVVTGKGAEPWMMVSNGKKNAWDDRAIVRDAIAGLLNNPARHA